VLEYHPRDGSAVAGKLSRLITYYGHSFTDGTLFTAPLNTWMIDELNNVVRPDAPVHSYRVIQYDEFGNKEEERRYSPGADKILGTEQDYLTQRKLYSTKSSITGGTELNLE